jgi:hypothetical protein
VAQRQGGPGGAPLWAAAWAGGAAAYPAGAAAAVAVDQVGAAARRLQVQVLMRGLVQWVAAAVGEQGLPLQGWQGL